MKKLYAAGLTTVALIVLVYPREVPANPPQSPVPAGALSIVSLNMAKEADCDRILRDFKSAPRLMQADVLLLQEVADSEGAPSVADKLAKRLAYYSAFSPEATGVHDRGLALVSRYPITGMKVQRLKEFDLRYHSRHRFALSADVQTPTGNIHFWNVHLDTRLNAVERLQQLTPVLEDAATHKGPRLIAGDFNTNEFYWFANVLPIPAGAGHGDLIRRQMQLRGFRTPFVSGVITFPQFRRQLDWIYASDLQTLGAAVEKVPFSDHRALWTAVRSTIQ